MKRIITLALALLMAMVCLTACGEELIAPSGTYSTESGSYRAEFTNYDAKKNVGDLTVIFTFAEVETRVSGKFSVAVNDPEANDFLIDFTPDNGELIEGFGGYKANDNAFVQLKDLKFDDTNTSGANTSYYAATPEVGGEAGSAA